ncbi:MAG: tRNA (adenosine(37)-N6)-threonylcarbamoyltransferase complex dimerization subunit type 1 TsaB [Mariprofundales bacterium]
MPNTMPDSISLVSLALDASCSTAVLCLQNANNTWTKMRHGSIHGCYLLPEIELLLKQANITFNDINNLVLGIGPGSFTGVRLATALFAGIATSATVTPDILHVSSLAITALQSNLQRLWVIEDARAGDVYCGYYHDGIAIIPESCLPWHKLDEFIATNTKNKTDMLVCQPENLAILEQYCDAKLITPISYKRTDALLQALSLAHNVLGDARWQPCYLRPPQAAKHAHKKNK